MPNIFTTLQILKDLRDTTGLNLDQKRFLTNILDEKALPFIIKHPSSQKVKQLNALLHDELNHTSYWNKISPLTNLKYIRDLKKVLTILTTVETDLTEEEQNTLTYAFEETISKKIDFLYEETVKTYEGQIMLPVMQSMDSAIRPFQEGQCFGYVAKWAIDLLLNNASYGVEIDATPIFKPIKLSSKVAKKYPDLNHLARMNDTISNLQAHQKDLENFLPSKANLENIYIYNRIIPHFYESISQIAQDLIKLSSENTIVGLNIQNYLSGHALGFAYKHGKYHFFDSNTGWYRFNQSEAFVRWLPFYFKTLGYDKAFLEHTIIRYSKDPVIGKELASRKVSANTFSTIALQLILSPITIPMVTLFAGYYYGIRGLIYGVNGIKNRFSNFRNPRLEHGDNLTGLMETVIKKDTNDIELFSSYRTIDALLDVSRKEIVNLAKKVTDNPIFTNKLKSNEASAKNSLGIPENSASKPKELIYNNLFFNFRVETIKLIDAAITNIENSSRYYRLQAKKHKLNVLKAMKDYLNETISFDQLNEIIQNNPHYADAISHSNTKDLVRRVLDMAANKESISLKKADTQTEIRFSMAANML